MKTENNEKVDDNHLIMRGEIVRISREKFHVQIENTETEVLAQLSGKMRMHNIRVLLGDTVVVKVSPYDMTRGFITTREK